VGVTAHRAEPERETSSIVPGCAPPPGTVLVEQAQAPPPAVDPWLGVPPVSAGSDRPRRRRAVRPVLATFVALGVVGGVVTVGWLAPGVLGGKRSAASTASPRPGEGPDTAITAPLTSTDPYGSTDAPTASPSVAPSAGTLLAADDFAATAVDTTRWDIYRATAPNKSTLSPSAVRVTNGELQIVGVGKDPTGQGNVSGGLCWCGTGGNQLYGKWQVRARFDPGSGYCPVIGLWPQSNRQSDGSITFAASNEADRHTLHAYLAWLTDHLVTSERKFAADLTGWHTYTVEWRAAFVKTYLDNKLIYDSTTTTDRLVIPRVPMHLFIQQAVGPVSGIAAAGPSTPDQVVTHIDWARIYL
jgi:endo-1,3-1,4-beta-glycanase ExoK